MLAAEAVKAMYRECGGSGELEGRSGHVTPQNLSDPFWRGRWCDRDWYVPPTQEEIFNGQGSIIPTLPGGPNREL